MGSSIGRKWWLLSQRPEFRSQAAHRGRGRRTWRERGWGTPGGPAGAPRGSASREVAPCARLSLSAGRSPPEAHGGFAGPAGCKAIAAEKGGGSCQSPQPTKPCPGGEGLALGHPAQPGAEPRVHCSRPHTPGLPARPLHLPLRPFPGTAAARGQGRAAAVAVGTHFAGLTPSTLWVLKIPVRDFWAVKSEQRVICCCCCSWGCSPSSLVLA